MVGKEFMKEVVLSWTLIHKCVGSYMSFVSLSTEKGPEETASCHLGTQTGHMWPKDGKGED